MLSSTYIAEMSDSKPGGADQSTSNGGGGKDPDPGGGRDDYSPIKNGEYKFL